MARQIRENHEGGALDPDDEEEELHLAVRGREKNLTDGILSFEVASAMSCAVHLHRFLSDPEVLRLHSEILTSHTIHALISTDEQHLISLAYRGGGEKGILEAFVSSV
ncbi:hypothetical protein J5N97_010256 [Dioscorea zingiberensis]|uniref:DUF3475 domain-containing protein n=1 Tax=Dioscorea zingiberensis TaxID=325984 RepID=A0A9D5CYT2_9LILI|nr:hypothetical protein J5N97_010256 [Dioscorea zingiberensis]